jgi:hypothetical protein
MESKSETISTSETCPHCQAFAARIATLERQLAETRQENTPLDFKALRLLDYGWGEGWSLRPSPMRRHWMDQVPYSYQCLPLVVANQWGWQLLCPTDLWVTWDGTPEPSGVRVDVDPQYAVAIKSQFGRGIVTFSPPYLFRTSPGWDLYLKGPGNRWKPNCVPLEGVIETWWLNYTFTLNWKLVEPGTVAFAKGESLGQLIPVPHDTFQGATASEAPITYEPNAAEELLRWRDERRKRASLPNRTHQLYRKAEGIEDHLVRISVPPILPMPNQNSTDPRTANTPPPDP